jgi:hypothetical protein
MLHEIKNPIQKPLSLEQRAIYDTVMSGRSSISNAVPGSGKSYTANTIAENWNGRVEFIPFMVSLKDEQRAYHAGNPHVNVNNFHSRGARLLGRVQLDHKKVKTLAANEFGKLGQKVAELVKNAKVEAFGIGGKLTMAEIAAKYGIGFNESEDNDADDSIEAMAIKVLALSDAMTSTVDHEDQLRFPVLQNKRGILKDCLIVLDEVQDYRPDSWIFLKTCLVTPENIAVLIGDTDQALMQFAGASVELFHEMGEYFKAVSNPITVNRRCAKAIVANCPSPSNRPHVALDSAPIGELSTMAEEDVLSSIRDGLYANDALLCEVNAPLVSLGIKLLVSGVPVRMRVTKIEGQLFRYAMHHFCNRSLKVGDIAPLMRDELAAASMEGDRKDLAEFKDIVQCVEALEMYCLANNIMKTAFRQRRPIHPIQQALEQLCSGNEGITLMTGHTAKGLEWNTVFHLPAKMRAPSTDWQVNQNACLDYVIKSRARLKFVTLTTADSGKSVSECVSDDYTPDDLGMFV